MSQWGSEQGAGDNDDPAIVQPIAVIQPMADETATSNNGLYRTMTVNMNGVIKRLMVPLSGIRDIKKNQAAARDNNVRPQTAKRSGPAPIPRVVAELNRRTNTAPPTDVPCYQIAPRPVTTQVIVPVSSPATTQGIARVARPVTTQVITPVSRPVTTQVITPVSRPVTTQVITPLSRPATTQGMAMVSRPATSQMIASPWAQPTTTLVLSPTGHVTQSDGTTFSLQPPIAASNAKIFTPDKPRNYSYFSRETGRILQLNNSKNKVVTTTAKTSSTTVPNQVTTLPVQYVQNMSTGLSSVAMMQQPPATIASGVPMPMFVMPGQTPASGSTLFKTAMQSRGTGALQAIPVSNAATVRNLPGSQQQQHPMHVNFAVSMPGKPGKPAQPLPMLVRQPMTKGNHVSPAVQTNQPLILSHGARPPVASGASLPFLIIPSTGGNNQTGNDLTTLQSVTTQSVVSTGTPALGTPSANNPSLYQVMNIPAVQRALDVGGNSNKTNTDIVPQPVAFLPTSYQLPPAVRPLVIQQQNRVASGGKGNVVSSQSTKKQTTAKPVSQNQKITSFFIDPVSNPATTPGVATPIVITPTSVPYRGRTSGKRTTPAVTSVSKGQDKSKPTPSLSTKTPISSTKTTNNSGDNKSKEGHSSSGVRPILPKHPTKYLDNKGTGWKATLGVNKSSSFSSSFDQFLAENSTKTVSADSDSEQKQSEKGENPNKPSEKQTNVDSHNISTPKGNKTKEVLWNNKMDSLIDKSYKENSNKQTPKTGKTVETPRSRKAKKETTNKISGKAKRRHREVSPSIDYALYSSKRTRLERRAKSGVKYNENYNISSSEDENETWNISEQVDGNHSDGNSVNESVGSNFSVRKANAGRATPLTTDESSDSDVLTEKPRRKASVISYNEDILPLAVAEINSAPYLESFKKDDSELDNCKTDDTSNKNALLHEGNACENLKAKWDNILGNKRNCFVRLHRVNLHGKHSFKVDWSGFKHSTASLWSDRASTGCDQARGTNRKQKPRPLCARAVSSNVHETNKSCVNSENVVSESPMRSECPMETVEASNTAVTGLTGEQTETGVYPVAVGTTTAESTSRSNSPVSGEIAIKENVDQHSEDSVVVDCAKSLASSETGLKPDLVDTGGDSVMLDSTKQGSVTSEKDCAKSLASSETGLKPDLVDTGGDSVMLESTKQGSVTSEKSPKQNVDQSVSDSVMDDGASTKSVLPVNSELPNKSSSKVVDTSKPNCSPWKWYTAPGDASATGIKQKPNANQANPNPLDSRNGEGKTTGSDFNVLKQHEFQLGDIREQLASLNS